MAEPTVVEGGTGNIMIGREGGNTVLIVQSGDGQMRLKMSPEVVVKLIGGLANSMAETVDELGQQLTEWIGVG